MSIYQLGIINLLFLSFPLFSLKEEDGGQQHYWILLLQCIFKREETWKKDSHNYRWWRWVGVLFPEKERKKNVKNACFQHNYFMTRMVIAMDSLVHSFERLLFAAMRCAIFLLAHLTVGDFKLSLDWFHTKRD